MTSMNSDYDEHYWQWLESQGYTKQNIDEQMRTARHQAKALITASGVSDKAGILDYGCGQGALTAALLELGYNAKGVDVSDWPIEHCLPQARDFVRLLDHRQLQVFGDDDFELVIAKDVLEHIGYHFLPDVVAELMRISKKVVFICPVTDETHHFICPGDEQDATHVTRLTRQEWLDFFPYKSTEKPETLALIRGAKNALGSVCVLLEHKS